MHNRAGEDNADAHLQRQIMGREVVVVTTGRLDGFAWLAEIFGTWERIFGGQPDGWPRSLDRRRRKRMLVKIIGESYQPESGHKPTTLFVVLGRDLLPVEAMRIPFDRSSVKWYTYGLDPSWRSIKDDRAAAFALADKALYPARQA